MDKILEEIANERRVQVARWGDAKQDGEQNSPADFVLYITHYATKWFKGGIPPHDTAEFRNSMIKVATLAVAAIEAQETKTNG